MECNKCGVCCKIFIVSLNEQEYKSGKYKLMFPHKPGDFEEAENCGHNILAQKEDKSCFYQEDDVCSIHKDRPICCRRFFCSSKEKDLEGPINMVKDFKKKNNLNS